MKQVTLKSKRNNSGIDNHSSNSLPLYPLSVPRQLENTIPIKNAIKINKNKLPSDFFINNRSESAPRNPVGSSTKSNFYYNNYHPQGRLFLASRKTQSQKPQLTADKATFFAFFDSQANNSHELNQTKFAKGGQNEVVSKLPLAKMKNLVDTKLDRNFQTREQSQRQSTIDLIESRHYTPVAHTTRSDLLALFPATYDNDTGDLIHITKYKKIKNTKNQMNKNEGADKNLEINFKHLRRKNQRGLDTTKSLKRNHRQGLSGRNTHVDSLFYQKDSDTIEMLNLNPEKQPLTQRKNYMQAEVCEYDPHNITFFNKKTVTMSKILPPVSSKMAHMG